MWISWESKKFRGNPIVKKQDPLKNENYRPVSLLLYVSNVFERILFAQVNDYLENKLEKYVTGFRESHRTQHSLMTML